MLERLDRYYFLHGLFRTVELGAGKDGTVYATNRGTAVKVHARDESNALGPRLPPFYQARTRLSVGNGSTAYHLQ